MWQNGQLMGTELPLPRKSFFIPFLLLKYHKFLTCLSPTLKKIPYLFELGHPLEKRHPLSFGFGNIVCNVLGIVFKIYSCFLLIKGLFPPSEKWQNLFLTETQLTINLHDINYCFIIVFPLFPNTNLVNVNINIGILLFLNILND